MRNVLNIVQPNDGFGDKCLAVIETRFYCNIPAETDKHFVF